MPYQTIERQGRFSNDAASLQSNRRTLRGQRHHDLFISSSGISM